MPVVLPTTPESPLKTKQEFLLKCGFPEVLGAIDCTPMQLRAPDIQAITYVNPKGVHSINIQVICDSSCLVTRVCQLPRVCTWLFHLSQFCYFYSLSRGCPLGWVVARWQWLSIKTLAVDALHYTPVLLTVFSVVPGQSSNIHFVYLKCILDIWTFWVVHYNTALRVSVHFL